MNKMKLARSLMILAYDDYLAGRFLINNGMTFHGAMLGSTAVEKYFKAILVLLGLDLKKMKVHLDRIDKLKAFFERTNYSSMFDYLDLVFLQELGKIYRFRYFDNIQSPETIGFFVNQFLGELDYTVFCMEKLIVIRDTEGTQINSRYAKSILEKDQRLFLNNYILQGLNKKEFMEMASEGFALHFEPNSFESYDISTTQKIKVPYNGKIMLIKAEIENRGKN